MLVSSSKWAASMKLAMHLVAKLPQDTNKWNKDTIKVVSKEVRAIKRLDTKLEVRVSWMVITAWLGQSCICEDA